MQTDGAPAVVAVIVNWNLPDLTLAAIESLYASDIPLQIIVVDNGSDLSCVTSLRANEGYILVELPTNRGFAAACNVGIRHALELGAMLVLLMNNDAIAAPEMLSILIDAVQADQQIGVVAPLILYANNPERIWRFGDYERWWFPLPQPLLRNAPRTAAPRHPIQVDYVTGCGMLVRREVFEHIGMFDECFEMYYEDADFCQRVRQSGYHILGIPTAYMWHHVSQTARINRPDTAFLWMRSRVHFYRRKAIGIKRLFLVGFLLATGMTSIGAALLRGDRRLAGALARGLVAGFAL